MTTVRPGEIEGVIRRGPDPRIRLVLVYGPDAGLVAERAKRLVAHFQAGNDDPFALVALEGDGLAADPGRLLDEAGTLGLFGGSRTIRVRTGGRSIAPAVEAVLKSEVAAARIVIEAGDLARSAPLRSLCEASALALAIPCYPDDARALADLIGETLGGQGLRIDREARALLAENLGSDRRVSLSELEKLALYALGQDAVTAEDVEAAVADAGASALNTLIDAAFAGRVREAEREIRRLRHEGLDPSAMLGGALRHALALLSHRLADPTAPPGELVAAWRGLHFKRKGMVETQFARWPAGRLRAVLAELQQAVLACRRADPALAQAQACAILLRIASEAAARGR